MKSFFQKLLAYSKAHKIIVTVIALVVVVGGYYTYKKATATTAPPRYILGTVARGTLISSISGTGQVAATSQVDIKPKVSGDIISVAVTQGQTVKAGDVIMRLDATDALKSVRDAQSSLTNAQISLQKTQLSSQTSIASSQADLSKAYDDAFTELTSAYTDLATLVNDDNTILNDWNHSPYMSDSQIRAIGGDTAANLRYQINLAFGGARAQYQTAFNTFQTLDRTSDQSQIDSILATTYTVQKNLADITTNLRALVQTIETDSRNASTQMKADQSTLDTDVSSANGHVASLFSSQQSILSARNSITSSSATLSGGLPLDVQSAQLNLVQAQNAVADANTTLADYTIRAPFDGVVAKLTLKPGDNLSSGTAAATMITTSEVATVSLNEIDVAKVATGDKVTLTFDAVPDLSISGSVIEVDTIGTVSQGVVSYSVQIGFDTQDNRIKPGMSVSASIITDTKPDVLMVPSTAIKSDSQGSYVQTVPGYTTANAQGITTAIAPQAISVETGSSNDTDTEITSGLNEGDVIITRTITASTVTTQSTTPSLFGGGGTRAGAAGGATRALGR